MSVLTRLAPRSPEQPTRLIAQRGTETVQQTIQAGVSMVTQMAERSVDQFASVFGFSGREAQETAEQSSRNVMAVAECSTVLAQGVQDISRASGWTGLRTSFKATSTGSMPCSVAVRRTSSLRVQSDQVRQNLELLVASTRRIAERSVQVADEAGRKLAVQAEESAGRARRSSDRARRAA